MLWSDLCKKEIILSCALFGKTFIRSAESQSLLITVFSRNVTAIIIFFAIWTLFKNMHCQGSCSLRLCISRLYCIQLKLGTRVNWQKELKVTRWQKTCSIKLMTVYIICVSKEVLSVNYSKLWYVSTLYNPHLSNQGERW